MEPTLGKLVMYRGRATDAWATAPAIVTAVWNRDYVNVTVFPDGAMATMRVSVRVEPEDMGKEHTVFPLPKSKYD